MNVDNLNMFLVEIFDESWRQDAHIAYEDDEVGVEGVDGCDEFLVELVSVSREVRPGVGLADEDGFEALIFCALKGKTIFLVRDDGGELDSGHVAVLDFVNNGLQVGTIGRSEDDDAKGICGSGHRVSVGWYSSFFNLQPLFF